MHAALLALLMGIASAADVGDAVEVVLSDGQVLAGELVSEDEAGVVLRLADGKELTLDAEVVKKVQEVETETGRWGADPNQNRYLYSPSAFMLGQGNGYLAQRALILTTAGVGIFDFWDLEAGAILPTLFIDGAASGVIGTKLGVPVHEKVRLGAGFQALFFGSEIMGLAFAEVTYGTLDTHATLAGGALLSLDRGEVGFYAATLSGTHRLGPKLALVTENWFLWVPQGGPWFDGFPLFIVPGGAVRLFGPSFSVDLGLVPVVTGASDLPLVPVPWISFSWSWSLRR